MPFVNEEVKVKFKKKDGTTIEVPAIKRKFVEVKDESKFVLDTMQLKIKNTINKLERIKREIDDSINYLKKIKPDTPRCSRCGWANVNVRKDKTYLCKSCGFDSRRLN